MEPPRGIEPRTCSLRGGRTTPTTASTSGNSCSSHTFGAPAAPFDLSSHHVDSTPPRCAAALDRDGAAPATDDWASCTDSSTPSERARRRSTGSVGTALPASNPRHGRPSHARTPASWCGSVPDDAQLPHPLFCCCRTATDDLSRLGGKNAGQPVQVLVLQRQGITLRHESVTSFVTLPTRGSAEHHDYSGSCPENRLRTGGIASATLPDQRVKGKPAPIQAHKLAGAAHSLLDERLRQPPPVHRQTQDRRRVLPLPRCRPHRDPPPDSDNPWFGGAGHRQPAVSRHRVWRRGCAARRRVGRGDRLRRRAPKEQEARSKPVPSVCRPTWEIPVVLHASYGKPKPLLKTLSSPSQVAPKLTINYVRRAVGRADRRGDHG